MADDILLIIDHSFSIVLLILSSFPLVCICLYGSQVPEQLHLMKKSFLHLLLYYYFDPPIVLILSIVPCLLASIGMWLLHQKVVIINDPIGR
jgi:hypothetical protein